MRKRSLLFTILLSGLMLSGLLTGCEKSTTTEGSTPAKQETAAPAGPAKVEVQEAANVQPAATASAQPAAGAGSLQIPAPQAIEDPAIFGMAKLRDPNQVIDRLAPWVAVFQPAMTADAMRAQAAMMMGIDLKDFRPGEALGLFAVAPAAAGGAPGAVAVLPVAPGTPTVQGLKMRVGDSVTTIGQHTLVASPGNPTAAQAVTQMGQKLIEQAKITAPNDIQGYVNVAGLMEKYGPMLTQQVQGLQMMMAMAAAQQGGDAAKMAQMQQVLQAEFQALVDALNQLQYINLGFDFGTDRLDLGLVAKGKSGTGLDKALQKAPVSAPDMTVYLRPDAILRAQQSMRDIKGFMALYMKYVGMMMGPAQQAGFEKLKGDLASLEKVGALDMGIAFTLSPEGKIIYEIISKADNNDAYIDFIKTKMTSLLNSGPFHDFYKGMGIDLKVTAEAPRQVAGSEVQRFKFNVDLTTATTAQEREKLQQLLGDLALEVGKVGEVVVAVIGEPFETVAKRVSDKQAGTPLQALQVYPAGGIFYADFSLGAMFNVLKTMAPPDQAANIPSLGADVPPLTMAGYHTGGLAYYRLGIPKGLVQAVAEAKAKAQAQGGQAGQAGMMPPAAPPLAPDAPPTTAPVPQPAP